MVLEVTRVLRGEGKESRKRSEEHKYEEDWREKKKKEGEEKGKDPTVAKGVGAKKSCKNTKNLIVYLCIKHRSQM